MCNVRTRPLVPTYPQIVDKLWTNRVQNQHSIHSGGMGAILPQNGSPRGTILPEEGKPRSKAY